MRHLIIQLFAGHIISPTAAPTPTPTPTPAPSSLFSDSVIVPDALSTFVTKSYFTAVLKKVRDQSSATSIYLSTTDDVSAVSILITAATLESATLARRLVGKQLEQSLAMMADREKNQKKLTPAIEEVSAKSAAESAEPLNILATVAMLHSASSSAETEKNKTIEEIRVQKEFTVEPVRSGSSSYGITRKKQTVDKEEVSHHRRSLNMNTMKIYFHLALIRDYEHRPNELNHDILSTSP